MALGAMHDAWWIQKLSIWCMFHNQFKLTAIEETDLRDTTIFDIEL